MSELTKSSTLPEFSSYLLENPGRGAKRRLALVSISTIITGDWWSLIFVFLPLLFHPLQLVSLARDGNLSDIINNDRTLDGLQLRFALVGGVFEAFQRNLTATIDWALLLVQLVTNGLIDLHTHNELFTTVIDMLSTLVHSALATNSQVKNNDESETSNRFNINV